jgi:hypothetical protein
MERSDTHHRAAPAVIAMMGIASLDPSDKAASHHLQA